MKVRAPSADSRYFDVKKLLHGLSLNTVCEEARCPNIAECWGRGTATFQILGDTCTRACRYCYVHSGKPDGPPDALEPLRVGQAAAQMALRHVVVTSVDRDDLPDRGAAHFAATIRAIKAKLPEANVEVLTPDFLGVEEEALETVLAARPEVFNHNIETVRRLHRRMRGAKASYDKALWLLARAKELADYPVLTKSGIIVGLGETNDEIVETMRDLRAHGVDVVTIGQYLQPSQQHATIDRWVHPGRVPLAARAGRGARLRLGLRRPARALELSRRRAAPRGRDRPRRRRLLERFAQPLRPDGHTRNDAYFRPHICRACARDASASAGTTKATLRVVDLTPLTVRGTGFHAEQSVRVAVSRDGTLLVRRTIRSGIRGGFTTRFAAVSLATAAAATSRSRPATRRGGSRRPSCRCPSARRRCAAVALLQQERRGPHSRPSSFPQG